ncbi:MAG: hypothetical protein MUF54_25910, partial [Polyangiaceae bacterium]|nr:hypothetical protein [Polyangiaceae bacterium]
SNGADRPRLRGGLGGRSIPAGAALGALVAAGARRALDPSVPVAPLLNARAVHSDAAIVGLQAAHMLQGEFDRFLWGAGYQGSFDALITAAVFLFTGGPSALGNPVAAIRPRERAPMTNGCPLAKTGTRGAPPLAPFAP